MKAIGLKLMTVLIVAVMLASVTSCDKKQPGKDSVSSSTVSGNVDSGLTDNTDSQGVESTDGSQTSNANESTGESTSTTGSSASVSKPNTSSSANVSIKGTTVKVHLGVKPTAKDNKIAAEFEKKTGCKVSYQVVAWSEFQTKFIQLVNSKKPMDYVTASDQEFVNYAAKNLIQPIDSYIDMNNKYFSKTFMDMFKWKGKHYVMFNPNNYIESYGFIFYNKTMFEDAGVTEPYDLYKQGKWNFSTFRETALKMTRDTNKDGKPDIRGFGTWWYDAFIGANGNSQVVLNSNGTIDITLNQKSAYTAMQLIEDMQLVDHSYDWNTNATDQFFNSKLAMIFERPWHAVGAYDMYNEDNFPDEIGICPPPKGTDTKGTQFAPVIIHGNAIPVGAGNPNGAVAWYLFNAEYANQHKNDADAVALRRRTISDEHLKIANDFIAKSTPICSHANGIGSWYFSKWDMWAGILRDNIPPATTVAKNINILKKEIAQTIGSGTSSGSIKD